MSKISDESSTIVQGEEAAYAKFRFVIVRVLIASIGSLFYYILPLPFRSMLSRSLANVSQ